MNAPRTVTIHTRDHGPLTLPEPAWCRGDHEHGGYRADICHTGPAHHATWNGYDLGIAELAQSPFAERLTRTLGVSVGIEELTQLLDPDDLTGLAATLVDYAGTLRGLAQQVTALLAAGEDQ